MKQVINNTPDDDNFDLVDMKAVRQEALERKALDKLREEVIPTEDGELEAIDLPLSLREQAKLDRAKLSSPMLEFDTVESVRDHTTVSMPDGHLYHESLNGEDLDD